jgi:hypothetical protein
MRCKGLFDTNRVVIIPVTDEGVADMMRQVKRYATHHQITIKTECGIFVKQDTMCVEKVIRCEVMDNPERYTISKIKKQRLSIEEKQKKIESVERFWREKEERNKKIINDYRHEYTVRELAQKYDMSRQAIYNILEKELDK